MDDFVRRLDILDRVRELANRVLEKEDAAGKFLGKKLVDSILQSDHGDERKFPPWQNKASKSGKSCNFFTYKKHITVIYCVEINRTCVEKGFGIDFGMGILTEI